jgi:hypothetical protein
MQQCIGINRDKTNIIDAIILQATNDSIQILIHVYDYLSLIANPYLLTIVFPPLTIPAYRCWRQSLL